MCTVIMCAFGSFSAYAKEVTAEISEGYTMTFTLPDGLPAPTVTSVSENVIKVRCETFVSGTYDGFKVYAYDTVAKKTVKKVVLKDDSCSIKGLKAGRVYKIKYRAFFTAGEKTYYGDYSETVKAATSPRAVKLRSVKYKGRGKLTASWKSAKDISGYVLQYSTSKSFNEKCTCTKVVGKSTLSKVIGGLAKRTYYVRVAPYKSVSGVKYTGSWSNTLSVGIKDGLSLKEMINYTKTNLDGRDAILEYTEKGVDIKKYKTTYDRIKAIYNWHAKNYNVKFENCVQCNSSFNTCIDALYGSKKKYDNFIWLGAGDFKNNDGSEVMHKWSVLYFSGVKYIFDPRLQGYTGNYTGDLYFGVKPSSQLGKKYLFDYWYCYWRDAQLLENGRLVFSK
jgi:hypothetical protein